MTGYPQGAARFKMSRKNRDFWPAAGLALDVLQATKGRVSETAELLGISTGNLVAFLQIESKVWEQPPSENIMMYR